MLLLFVSLLGFFLVGLFIIFLMLFNKFNI